MAGLMLILFVLVLVQLALVYGKMKKLQHSDDLMRINELMYYADNRKYDVFDDEGLDVLMIAAANHFNTLKGEYGYFDVLKKAVENGFNMNKHSLASGKTPLMYAVRNSENKQVSKYLLEAGADVNMKDKDGRTVLFDAVKRQTDSCYEEIVTKINDINHQDSYGITALMIAAYEMHLDRIEDLLDRGANVKLKNHAGENAYDVAKKYLFRHIQCAVESETLDEGGKPSNMTTSEDVLNAQEHNHEVREMVRRLECIVHDEAYAYVPFKRPLFNTRKAK